MRQPRVTLESLRARDGDFCCYCGTHLSFTCGQYGSNRATLEHITPISRGGDHVFDNTAIACRACNISKHTATLLFEWVARRT